MKILILYCFSCLLTWFICSEKNRNAPVPKQSAFIFKDSIDNSSRVQPILVKHCSPCHFSGGKMYSRLPFDKDTTIRNHGAGILKRIKNEEENSVIRNFIQQNKNGSSGEMSH